MKFMKLGFKDDIFTVRGSSTSVDSELPSDITFDVDGHEFHLHKFPLLAKWGCLNKLMQESQGEEVLIIHGFPGGAPCFAMCARYCYGITVTVSPHNLVEVRCGAEFLQMTEETEKSNLVYKLEVFLDASVLRGWKDAVICLRSCTAHMPWSQDLTIIDRCIQSISSKTCVNTDAVDWSFTYSRPPPSHQAFNSERSSPVSRSKNSRRMSPAPEDWWVEDISDLDIDLYRRLILAIKAKGAPQKIIAESIRIYTLTCLGATLQHPSSPQKLLETTAMEKLILETIVTLLPLEKGTCSSGFLLQLLKAAVFLNASSSTKTELVRRVGLQLDEASLHDVMIPSVSYASETVCDVDLMIEIVEQFMTQFQGAEPFSSDQSSTQLLTESDDVDSSYHVRDSQCKVAKVVDRYLAEIARDANMSVSKFMQLAASVPDDSRLSHDGLYRAIDMYLKEHPLLTKSERKKICRLMDCKKLSMEACMHAAQNERLPLRVMVEVSFFDHVRTALNGGVRSGSQQGSIQQSEYGEESSLLETSFSDTSDGNSRNEVSTVDETWESVHRDFTALKGGLASIKMRLAEAERESNSTTQQHQRQQRKQQDHVKTSKGVLSAFKPEKLFCKLFASRALSSNESFRDSISSEMTSDNMIKSQKT